MYGYGTTQTPYAAGATTSTGYGVVTPATTEASPYSYSSTYGSTGYDASAYGTTGYSTTTYDTTGYGTMGYGTTATGYGTSSAYGPYGTSTDTSTYGYGYQVGDTATGYGMMGTTTTSTWPNQPPPPPPDTGPKDLKDSNTNWRSFESKMKMSPKKPMMGMNPKPIGAATPKQKLIKQFYDDVQLPAPVAMEESDDDDVEPGKEYFCTICDYDCKTLNAYINHTRGLKHAQKAMEEDHAKNQPKSSGNDAAVSTSVPPPPPPVYKPPVQNKPATTYPDTSMFSTFLKLPGSETADEEPTMLPGGEEVQMGSGTSTSYYCEVCCCMMSGPKAFEAHMTGTRHKKNLKHRAEGNPITKGRTGKKGTPDALNFAPNLPGRASIMTALEKVTDPLIGLQFITEFQKPGANFEHRYVCNMCENMCDPRTLVSHIIGSRHRINYMKERYMNYYSIVKQKSGKKSEQTVLVEEYARTIECEEGRQDVKVKKDTEGFAGVIKAPTKDVPIQPPQSKNSKRKGGNDEFGGKRGRGNSNRGDGGMRGGFNGSNNMRSGFGTNIASLFDDIGMNNSKNIGGWQGNRGRGGRNNNFGGSNDGFDGDNEDNFGGNFGGNRGGFGGNRGGFGGNRGGFGGNRGGFGDNEDDDFGGNRGGFDGNRGGLGGNRGGFGGNRGGFGGNRGGFGDNEDDDFGGNRGGFGGNRGGFGGNRGGFGGNRGGFGGNRGGFGGNEGGFDDDEDGFCGNQGGFGGNRGGFDGNRGGNRGGFGGNRGGFGNNQDDDFGGNRGGFVGNRGGNRGGFGGNRGGCGNNQDDDFVGNRGGFGGNRGGNRGGFGGNQNNEGGGRGRGRGQGPKSRDKSGKEDDVQISSVKGGATAGIGKFLEEMANCLVNNEQDATMALEVSNQLTNALMDFRMKGISQKLDKNAAKKEN